jgi:RHS repeat-associated protein
MNRTSIRAATLACALLTSTAIVSPALAQAGAPPSRYQYDKNGVDVARGTWASYVTDLSIGPSGHGGLSYVRGFGQPVAGNNWNLTIYEDVTGTTASVGFTNYTFSKSGSTYTSTDGSGATLVLAGGTYTLTAGDGSVVVYGYTTHDTNDGFVVKARGTTITYPTGEKVTLTWHSDGWCSSNLGCPPGSFITGVRLQAVSSSLGFQLHFFYGKDVILVPANGTGWRKLNTITAFNTAVDYCDPAGFTCSFSQTWPSVSYATFETVTDPMGRNSIYHLTTNGWTMQRPSSSTANITVTQDTNGNIASFARDGMTWNYSYSVAGSTATMTVTDPLSHSQTITSDLTVGLPTSIQNEVGQTTSYHYGSSGLLDQVTAPEGNYAQYTYDSRGNLTQTLSHAKTGSGLSDITTSATYPSSCTNVVTCNQPTSRTDARGNTTDYSYDSTHGGVLTVTLPAPTTGAARPQTRYTYSALQAYYKNSSGAIVASGINTYRPTAVSSCQTNSSCSGTSDEAKATIAYGSTGVANNLLPTTISSGAGDGSLTATTTTTYDTVGNPYTVDGPLSGSGDTTRFVYDADRELVGTMGPDPDGAGSLTHRSIRTTYNADGLATKVEQGTTTGQSDTDWGNFSSLQAAETDYDGADRPTVRRTTSGGAIYSLAQISYDGEGRPICTAVRMNPTYFTSLPSDACTLGTTGSYGPDRITRATYDAVDRTTLVQSAYGVTGVESDDVATTYTNNGLVSTVKDAEGNLTTYGYDGFDRRILMQYPSLTKNAGSSSSTDYEQYGFDANGNIASFRNRANETISFTYDALNRVTAKDLPGTEPDISYGYNLLGRMTSTSETGNSLTFTYDALGRNLTQVGPQGTMTSTWDLAGRRTQLMWPDSFYINYDYLTTGEVSAVRENGATSGIGMLATYAYDNLGRRTSVTRGNGSSTSYSYDAASRLTQLADDLSGTTYDQTRGFSYDPAGGVIQNTRSNDSYAWGGHGSGSTSSTTNGLNQLTTIGSATPTYDSRGNLTYAGGTTYSFSSENLLTGSTGGASLTYDPLMRLYQLSGGPAGTQRFAYDGLNLTAEYNSSNTILRRYVFGPGADEPIAWYEGSGTSDRRFLQGDERGSVVSVADSAGTPLSINTYDEYGKPASSNSGRFLYTGQAYLPEVGLYYYKTRMYASGLGRFLQTDPIGYGDGANVYAYVHGDPINLSDPSGTSCVDWQDQGTVTTDTDGTIVVQPGAKHEQCWNDDVANNAIFPPGIDPFAPQNEDCSGNCTPIVVHGRRHSNFDILDLQLSLCEGGNRLVEGADAAGSIGYRLAQGGVATFIRGLQQRDPAKIGAGVALIETGDIFGEAAGTLQFVGGIGQRIGGGGGHNSLAAAVSLGTGVLVSRALKASIPRGFHGETLARAQRNNTAAGGVASVLMNLSDWLAPTQVQCP